MFGIGGFELFLILLFGFLVFGPDKLPEIAQTVGKAIAKFRGAQESMTEKLKDVTLLDKDSENLIKNPLDILSGTSSAPKKDEGASEKSASTSTTASNAGATQSKASESSESTSSKSEESTQRSESFAERKARYDRERAKRKQAEVEAAKEAEEKAAKETAVKKEAADNPKIDIASKSVKEEGE